MENLGAVVIVDKLEHLLIYILVDIYFSIS